MVLRTAHFRRFPFWFGILLKPFCTEQSEQYSVVTFYILAKENAWSEIRLTLGNTCEFDCFTTWPDWNFPKSGRLQLAEPALFHSIIMIGFHLSVTRKGTVCNRNTSCPFGLLKMSIEATDVHPHVSNSLQVRPATRHLHSVATLTPVISWLHRPIIFLFSSCKSAYILPAYVADRQKKIFENSPVTLVG